MFPAGADEPVSVDSRTGLCSPRQFLPGKTLAWPETGQGFFGEGWLLRLAPLPCLPTQRFLAHRRLFRRRHETRVAQDCVVADAFLDNRLAIFSLVQVAFLQW